MGMTMQKRQKRDFTIQIPPDLSWLDEDCKVWARVIRDRAPAPYENAIYRAMRRYGDNPWRPAEQPLMAPLTAEQTARGWEIDAAVKRMPWLYRNALIAWYIVPLSNPRWIARRMRITVRELGQRLGGALNLLELLLKKPNVVS